MDVGAQSRSQAWTRLIIVGVVALMLLGIAVLTRESEPIASPTAASAPTATSVAVADFDNEARVACEQFVQDQLRAPSTARFSPKDGTNVTRMGTEWAIKGWVDSQNAYGAMLRSEYDCATTLSGNSWQLVGQVVIRPR